jgi:hypothetical protein
MPTLRIPLIFAVAALACGPAPAPEAIDAGPPDAGGRTWDPTLFATHVVTYVPGEGAGFGQDRFPDVVFGPPHGKGPEAGSLDVLSLGRGGEIVLGFDREILDGEGPDLLVFENPFSGFVETAVVGASEDGTTFVEWPCADGEGPAYEGCAGVRSVLSSPENGVDPTDPAVAGGDAFDLGAIGLARARFVRIRDSGKNRYEGSSGGFDLDAVSIVHAGEVGR